MAMTDAMDEAVGGTPVGPVPAQAGSAPDDDASVIRVVVVDDHATIGQLLSMALSSEPDVRCVGTATTAGAGLALIAREHPDVVLMDLQLPDLDGIQATLRVRESFPDVRVVMLTAAEERRYIAQAAAAGASAFVSKTGDLTEVLSAVRTARSGSMTVDAALLATILDHAPAGRPAATPAPNLTPRELEVLQLLGLGLDVTRTARRLDISVHTCRGYVKSLLTKLDCHSQLEAVVVATRLGLIDVPRDR